MSNGEAECWSVSGFVRFWADIQSQETLLLGFLLCLKRDKCREQNVEKSDDEQFI